MTKPTPSAKAGKVKFNPNAKCPKCSGKDISAQYCEKAWPESDHELSEKEPHIHRHCRRCHYEWDEAPLEYSK